MAKRKKASKVQKPAKPRSSAKRGKARRVSKVAKATKRTVASAKPKPAPVKKAARKVKQPVAPAVETVAVEVIEQPVAVTEVEETRQAEPGTTERLAQKKNPKQNTRLGFLWTRRQKLTTHRLASIHVHVPRI
jgi:hypothetical protein